MVTDAHGRHAAMVSRRNEGGANAAVTAGVTSFKAGMSLNDDRLLDVVPEPWWTIEDPAQPGMNITPTVTMVTRPASLSRATTSAEGAPANEATRTPSVIMSAMRSERSAWFGSRFTPNGSPSPTSQ